MSAKATGLVWDLVCPALVNQVPFRPNHKFVLVAYADHADHAGRNIYPAINTVCKKTGLDDRTVQRMTRDLELMGLLIADGQGPRGTNRWMLPFGEGGVTLTPVRMTGVTGAESLGVNPSGVNPSGVTVTPEFKEPLTNHIESIELKDFMIAWESAKDFLKPDMTRMSFNEYVSPTRAISFDEGILRIEVPSLEAVSWLESRVRSAAERYLIGPMNSEVSVSFVTGGVSV